MNAQAPNVPTIPRTDTESPGEPGALGPLRGQVWLTLQTRQAQQLVRGRSAAPDKAAITGLVGFADRLRVIWQAARNDDPYADWWLLKVHECIEAAGTLIGHRQQALDILLQQVGSMEVTIAASQKPFRMPLQFANPYAYQGARLLSVYDTLACHALTAQHVGLLDSHSCSAELGQCARKVRSVFAIPQSYRFLGIDRLQVRQDNGESQRAHQLMGELPEDVLSGERQAPLAPRRMRFPAGFAGSVGLHPESNPRRPDSENDAP